MNLVQQWDGTWLLSGQFHNARRGVLKVTYEVDPFPHDGQTNSMKWFKVLDTVYSYTAAGTATGTFSVLLHEGLTFASSSGNLMSFHDGSLQTSIPVYYSSPEPLGRVPLPATNTPVAPDRGVTPTDPVGDYRPGPAGDVPPAR